MVLSQQFKVLMSGTGLSRLIHRMTVYKNVEVHHTSI